MRPTVSISVPVYKVEQHLRKCLDSLINQSLKDIEIILVDDGSPDGSGAICDEYAQKDSRIKVIHKENGGLWTARQIALENATGYYFCACDSDDWTEPDMYESLYNRAIETGADVVICDYYTNYSDGRQIENNLNLTDLDRSFVIDKALNGNFPCMIWNKMFKLEFLKINNIEWEPNINQGEDFVLFMKLLQNPIHIEYLPKTLYHYNRRLDDNSYTSNITLSTYYQLLQIRKWLIDNYDMKKYPKAIFNLWISLAFSGLRVKKGMNSKIYYDTAIRHINFFNFIKYKSYSLKSLIILYTKVFGYKSGKWIVDKTYKKLSV